MLLLLLALGNLGGTFGTPVVESGLDLIPKVESESKVGIESRLDAQSILKLHYFNSLFD